MRVLFDVNVVLDVLLKREPWHSDASKLWDAVVAGKLEGYLAPTTLTTIFYLSRKLPLGAEGARRAVETCLNTFEICSMDRRTLELAVASTGRDFEDDVQIACAQLTQLDAIVTRDIKHFEGTTCRVFSPPALVDAL